MSKVEELNLQRNEIGPNGAKAIAALCAVRGSLTRLVVSANFLDRGGEGVRLLRDAVSGREGLVLIDRNNA